MCPLWFVLLEIINHRGTEDTEMHREEVSFRAKPVCEVSSCRLAPPLHAERRELNWLAYLATAVEL